MSVRNLDGLFEPTSVAVIGASRRPRSVGSVVVRNLLEGGFAGPIMPVNPRYDAVHGILAYRDVHELPVVPDLAVICTPPATVAKIVGQLAERGTRGVVVLTAGLQLHRDVDGRSLEQVMLEAARPHCMRILGPNCVGLLAPAIGLNASFAHSGAAPGHLAFLSQSGAMCTAVLDWARGRKIGFSYYVSLGDSLDVDFADVIDYLGGHAQTRAILLYIESVKNARKFLSAVRAASRNKPVVAIKSGRFEEGEKAAASHTGALAGSDLVYEYALRRAGVLRVHEIDELFDAVETLARAGPLRGDRLAVLTNGGGPGVMVADALAEGGRQLAQLSPMTLAKLDEALPATWSRSNPVDILGDAPAERYRRCAEILASAPEVDALLVLYAPTAVVSGEDVAQAVIEATREARPAVLTSWLGGSIVAEARRRFGEAGIPSYETPGDAVRAFLHMSRYRRGQDLLRQTPPQAAGIHLQACPPPVVSEILETKRGWLSEVESKQLLSAYGIPVVPTLLAKTVAEAQVCATRLGYPVALKILSPDVLHKSDVGGVSLDLETPRALREAAKAMTRRLRQHHPQALLEGFSVQKMARRPAAYELFLGASVDPIFGPFLMFGQGGIAVEVLQDQAVAIPPLNLTLARELVQRTRVWHLLRGYRHRPAVQLDDLCQVLVQVSQLLVEVGEVAELDLNPLLADESGVLALDARVRLQDCPLPAADRLAIRPYPRELEEQWTLDSGDRVLVRPIRPDDEAAHMQFFRRLSEEDVLFRFFNVIREFPPAELARYTQIDYDREMAFLVVDQRPESGNETLGVVRAIADSSNSCAEFGIVIRSDWKGRGLGRRLLEKMIRYCRQRGTETLVGRVLAGNQAMLELARDLGFEVSTSGDGEREVRLRLTAPLGQTVT